MKKMVSNSGSSKTFQPPSSADIAALDRKSAQAAANPKGATVSRKRR